MYADSVTPSMERAISETVRRRALQMAYNEAHGITPRSVEKGVRDLLEISARGQVEESTGKKLTHRERLRLIEQLTKEMRAAARLLEFEHAAYLRDQIAKLEQPDAAPQVKESPGQKRKSARRQRG